ncbi:hypothetical protein [Xanthobacter sp. KR7-225]|uniref:hypothetical protein n=1 Tax=Xanthobacter sp. KR7-225 TaxID=3156613 RepID=UPI0032B471DA
MEDIEAALIDLKRSIDKQNEVQEQTNNLLYAVNDSIRATAQEIADLKAFLLQGTKAGAKPD